MFDPARFYSAPEVWRLSHAPRDLIYEALRSGELRSIRRGKRWLIPGSAALEWAGGSAKGGDPA
jgi:excisionase family DNA binding protein